MEKIVFINGVHAGEANKKIKTRKVDLMFKQKDEDNIRCSDVIESDVTRAR